MKQSPKIKFTLTPKFGVTSRSKGGFTLIEMMVAVSVFIVIITISLTSILNVSNVQRKITSFRAVNDNLNFAIEKMAREIRTGDAYCAQSCSSPSSFNFTNSDGKLVKYSLIDKKIEVSYDGGDFLPMTSSKVTVENLLFIVKGDGPDGLQPLVSIIINGYAGKKETVKSRLNIQTTVSQRSIDS